MENTCDDFLAFQEALKKMRKVDDNIIHLLNTTIPTDSFSSGSQEVGHQCQQLYLQLNNSYEQRENAIKTCINVVSSRVKTLKDERELNDSNLDVIKALRKENSRLRLMQNELNVEEIVKDRTLKVFYERCRAFYKPSNIRV